MADNFDQFEQSAEQILDNTRGPGAILAEEHKSLLFELSQKAGKYTGLAFKARKEPIAGVVPVGTFFWNSNALNTTTDFTVTFSGKTADLNDPGLVLNKLQNGDIIHFKDYAGRSAYFIFKSVAAGTDSGGAVKYDVVLAGVADNSNYIYQAADDQIAVIEFLTFAVPPKEYEIQFVAPNFILLENGVPKTTLDLSVTITETIEASETSLTAFLTNNGNYTYQQGDVISIVSAPDNILELYLFKGGTKTTAANYQKIDVSKIDWSNVLNTPDNITSLEVRDINGVPQFTITDFIEIVGGVFDSANKRFTVSPLLKNTYFVDPILGDDSTGEFQNPDKPFQTIDAILDLFPRNSVNSGLYCRIQFLRDGNYPIENQIGYYNLEFVSDFESFVDLTNFGDSAAGIENVYYTPNVSGRYDLIFNLPRGGIKNTSSNNGGRFSSEDVDTFINVDKIEWTAGSSIAPSVTINKLNTFNSNGSLPSKNAVIIDTLNASIASPFGNNADVTVANLITNDVVNLIPDGTKWNIGDITGDLAWTFSHNKSYDIFFNNSSWNGKLSFTSNVGNFTFSGVVKKMEYLVATSIFNDADAQAGRVPNLNFVNFTCLDFKGFFNMNGSAPYQWNFRNCFIRKTDTTSLLLLKNTSEGTINFDECTILRPDNNIGTLVTALENASGVLININGLNTNFQDITDNANFTILFNSNLITKAVRLLGEDGLYHEIYVDNTGNLTSRTI